MKWPWSPTPFIPDEKPWEDRWNWRPLVVCTLVVLGASLLCAATMFRLDGHGDMLRLRLAPQDAKDVVARVVDTQTSPSRLTYTFNYPPGSARVYIKTVGVPLDVARRLRTGAKLDIVCLAAHPQVSAPRGQAAIGTRFYLTTVCVWAMYVALLGIAPLVIAVMRRVGRGLTGKKPRLQLY